MLLRIYIIINIPLLYILLFMDVGKIQILLSWRLIVSMLVIVRVLLLFLILIMFIWALRICIWIWIWASLGYVCAIHTDVPWVFIIELVISATHCCLSRVVSIALASLVWHWSNGLIISSLGLILPIGHTLHMRVIILLCTRVLTLAVHYLVLYSKWNLN